MRDPCEGRENDTCVNEHPACVACCLEATGGDNGYVASCRVKDTGVPFTRVELQLQGRGFAWLDDLAGEPTVTTTAETKGRLGYTNPGLSCGES
jgi:hypothetical protein